MTSLPALCALAAAALLAVTAGSAAAGPPLVGSRCPGGALVDPVFRDAALSALERLVIRAPGQPADGAVRAHETASHVDPQGGSWYQVSAYQVNLGVVGALNTGPRVLPLVAGWLRWQARHTPSAGATRGVVLDTWIRSDTLQESTCPAGVAPDLCNDVDAYDSTAASFLLAADAYLRHGGDVQLLREPAVRQALEDAASALAALLTPDGLTIAKPAYPLVYVMDNVEVAAGWQAWARLQRDAYVQPASADITAATAARAESAVRKVLAFEGGWTVSVASGAPRRTRWYADTVSQAWPLLWLPEQVGEPDRARTHWQRAVAWWQRGERHWARLNVDPDGFWWPAVAVAATCTGDNTNAATWVARARQRWLDPKDPFAWPFQVGDLLWLLWMADTTPAAPATRADPPLRAAVPVPVPVPVSRTRQNR